MTRTCNRSPHQGETEPWCLGAFLSPRSRPRFVVLREPRTAHVSPGARRLSEANLVGVPEVWTRRSRRRRCGPGGVTPEVWPWRCDPGGVVPEVPSSSRHRGWKGRRCRVATVNCVVSRWTCRKSLGVSSSWGPWGKDLKGGFEYPHGTPGGRSLLCDSWEGWWFHLWFPQTSDTGVADTKHYASYRADVYLYCMYYMSSPSVFIYVSHSISLDLDWYGV